ncbi:rubrerythrin-like domain-containing protein [Haloferax marisrubri]|uniref:Protease La-like protein type 2 n=1 Tax=Haloferax marisrubri TaxID=1544719 RepID=A0A2P4NQ39_9EURY|nr:rubrerythrin-like domain-containing protein [Haloferax marisrubri]POG55251.1 protease La-like protein type 2 [Haloferax marisrubri]
MSKDIATREPADLVKAKSRALVDPEPTDLVERRPAELVERRTEALVERRTEMLVEADPTALVERSRYECTACGYRSGHGVYEQVCPRCGGSLKNIGVAQE